MSPRTVFLGKFFGIYCTLVAMALLVRGRDIVDIVTALLHNQPLLLILGVFTLLGGVALVLCHNVWTGGAFPIIVTLIGWITLIKGLLLLLLTPDKQVNFVLGGLRYGQLFYLYMAITLVLGLYLTHAAYRSSPQ
jgi:hypothetical protein